MAGERTELEAVTRELRSVILQMEELAAQLRGGFAGIGSEYCARAVEMAAARCRLVQKGLSGAAAAAPKEQGS